MVGSFVLMLPAVVGTMRARRLKAMYVGTIVLTLLAQLAMPWLEHGVWPIAVFLLMFFTGFNALEAHLPTLVTRVAPRRARGIAIGVFSSFQFLGAFFGATAGGFLYDRWQTEGIVLLDAMLLVIWLLTALGTRVPEARESGQREA